MSKAAADKHGDEVDNYAIGTELATRRKFGVNAE
jgi:hypothetical protein